MKHSLLPNVGALILCACSFTALAAETTTTTPSAEKTYGQQTRQTIEQKRDRISGADRVAVKEAKKSSELLLDEPVDTTDAQTQEEQQ